MSRSAVSVLLHPLVPGAVYQAVLARQTGSVFSVALDVEAPPVPATREGASSRGIDVFSMPDEGPKLLTGPVASPAESVARSGARFTGLSDARPAGADASQAATLTVPKDLKINSWEDLKPYFDDLQNRPVESAADLEKLILDYSLLSAVVSEAYAWAYINLSRYTKNPEYQARLEFFDTQISPQSDPASNAVNERISKSPFLDVLPEERYGQLKRILKRRLEMFNEKNVPLLTELAGLQTQYGKITGGITVDVDGTPVSYSEARGLMRSNDRAFRERVWLKLQEAFAAVKPELDALYDKMVKLRHQVALNAGFDNYRDYAHKDRMRFDYSVKDTQDFADAIEKHVVPLAKEIYRRQESELGLAPGELKPWDAHWRDMAAAPGEEPLNPFDDADELKAKAIEVFTRLKPEFGANLRKMDEANLFDLETRPDKEAGGYNYPLSITGMPFIFMNASGTHGDLETMMHEGGHAMHTFLTNTEPLTWYQDTPAEMAETASMAMEQLTMPYWDQYYENPDDLRRAKREQLEGAILFLPWMAVVDSIQQWAYENPEHTAAQRDAKFKELLGRFGLREADWTGFEDYLMTDFMAQGHIFKSPFYYLEYGIAQLGSLQIFRNSVEDPAAALKGYIRGLSLGNSKPLPEVWDAMGIDFDFSADKIRELMTFVSGELGKLE